MAGRYGLVTRVAIRAPLVLSVYRPVLCRPTGLQHEHALRVMALRAVTKNPYYQQRDMLVTVSQFTGLGGWQSKNPDCCRIADTEPNNLRELRKSPSSSLIYPTSCHSNSAAGYPSGLAVLRQLPPASCFTEPQPRLRARHTHRMHRVPASIASAGGSKYSCNRIVKETSARSFIDCTPAVYRYRLRRIFKKGTPGTIVITRRLMLI